MSKYKTKIWDDFTRIYHMSQLILLALLWYSADQGDFENHFIYAFILLALVITRLCWGFIGSQNSRFSQFIKMPWRLPLLYKNKQLFHSDQGHAPLSGYMVLALLGLLSAQLFTGLFATDDVLAEGPLMYYVSEDTAEWLDSLHSRIFDVLLYFIGAHVIAAIAHQTTGDKIITTILTGYRQTKTQVIFYWRSSLIALVLWAALIAIIFYFFYDSSAI